MRGRLWAGARTGEIKPKPSKARRKRWCPAFRPGAVTVDCRGSTQKAKTVAVAGAVRNAERATHALPPFLDWPPPLSLDNSRFKYSDKFTGRPVFADFLMWFSSSVTRLFFGAWGNVT